MPRRLCRRHRVRLIWLTLFALLFQQVTLAAHVCAQPLAESTVRTAVDAHCDQPPEQSPFDPVCQKHCSPERAAAADNASFKVPPSLLSAPVPLLSRAQATAVAALPAPPRGAVDPPPPLRFCALLI